MREAKNLSRDAFALLVRIMDHPRMAISASLLLEEFSRLAPELIDGGWLTPVGNQAALAVPGEDDHSFHELVWDSERKQYKYFTPSSGWVFVAADTMKRHAVDDDRFLAFLQHRLGIPGSQPVTCLHDPILWHLGSARFDGYRAHLYFVRRLDGPENRVAFLRAMRREIGKTPAIILCTGKKEPVDLELPVDQALVPIHQVMVRDRDVFSVDEDAVHAVLRGTPGADESRGGIGLRFSTDYRIVHWNGEQYKLTKKQSAVLECLHREGGRAHKDLLCAEACTNEDLHRIMRNKVDGKWVQHPLWNSLIKSEGNGYYYLGQ